MKALASARTLLANGGSRLDGITAGQAANHDASAAEDTKLGS
jgi:hypothetical protein